MEFCEKLQELRKRKGLTQEELAEALYVSRTAVSKWESGRGYPSIDSLREIAGYFSVSIDELLSGERLLSIAERENAANVRNLCELLFGVTDLLSVMLIVLPLYPKTVDGYVYGVNLAAYTATATWNRAACWVLFSTLILMGALKILLARMKAEKRQKGVTAGSVALGIAAVILLAMTGQTYAVVAAFLLLIVKAVLLQMILHKSGNRG